MKPKAIVLILLIFIVRYYAIAQFPFDKKIDVEEENITLRSNVLLKDHFGFLWIGTSEGVFKFNGTVPQRIENDLPADKLYITALAEDKEGNIWAGCKNGTLITIKDQQLSIFSSTEGMPRTTITALLSDDKNRLWIGTAGEGIYYKEKNTVKHILSKDGLSDDNINCLYAVNENEIIAGTDRGLSVIKNIQGKNKIEFFTTKNGLPDNIIKCILPSAETNRFWIGTQSKGLLLFDIGTKEILPITGEWVYGQINAVCISANYLFIATEQKGLVSYDTISKKLSHTIFKDSLFGHRISDIKTDNEENVWLATDNKLISFTGQWLTYWMNAGGITLSRIHTLYADDDDNLWLTPDQRLYKAAQMFKKLPADFLGFDITPPNELIDITSLYKDKFDFLWVGTMGKGIYRLNMQSGIKKQLTENPLTNNGHILSIAGKENEIWISSLNGVTKFTLAEENNQLAKNIANKNYSKKDGLGSDYIYHILVDSKNKVWFATDGAGVSVYENGVFTNYYNNGLFSSKVAYSLTEDMQNHVWVSTYNDGLYEFDGKKFINYNLKNGLTDLAITSIASDDCGNIIAVNKKGIDVFNPLKNFVQHFGSESGFTEQQPNLNSITKDAAGNIWIGTENGIVKFVPNCSFGNTAPVAVIENVLLFGMPVNTASVNTFKYNQNSFTFKVAAAYYKAPEKIKFQYWLEGYSDKWETTADKMIVFPQLVPGKYTFKIRASANESFESAKIYSYSFFIQRSFWTTWWFRLLLLLVVAVLVYRLVWERIKSIRKKEKLAREKFQLQYDALKHQVNPHFYLTA